MFTQIVSNFFYMLVWINIYQFTLHFPYGSKHVKGKVNHIHFLCPDKVHSRCENIVVSTIEILVF
jgi:hypothetical protein